MAFVLSTFCIFQYDGRIDVACADELLSEWILHFIFDEENSKKLIAELQKKYQGSVDEMIRQGFLSDSRFGNIFLMSAFCEFCEKNDIKYEYEQELTV